jgi:hypothetical protein
MRNKLLIFLLFLAGNCLAQISPGDLTTAHSNLEGLSNCTKCHEVGKKVASTKCLECHKEIKELIDAGQGYHSSAEVKSKDCFSCHNEHHGRNFKIVRFDTLKFDHKDSRFELLGKHKTLACKSCHKSELIRVKKSQKTGAGSYLGLGTKCLDCHADYHQNSLSTNCLNCHNNTAFKPVTGFDHKKTKFPLLGKHQSVECVKCHKITESDGKKSQKFTGIAFSACTDCHKDIHENKFGKDCRKCHNEESFKKVAGINTFDHGKTDYPLEGKHLTVECKSCHKQNLTAKLSFGQCTDCHKDYHKGQLKKPGIKSDCKDCHTLAGFTNSNFTIERHNKGEFLLEGSHLATPCISCHKKDKEWVFKDLKKNCVDCHENIHKSFIAEKYFGNQKCESCHSVTAWSKVKFDHNTTNFKLTGKHAEAECKKCHFKQDPDGTIKQRFSDLKGRCLDCHTDVHNNQFDTSEIASCTNCHGYDRWKPVQFNHDKTRFKLDGSHKDVACAKCHKEVSVGNVRYIQYKFADIKCSSCHLRK